MWIILVFFCNLFELKFNFCRFFYAHFSKLVRYLKVDWNKVDNLQRFMIYFYSIHFLSSIVRL